MPRFALAAVSLSVFAFSAAACGGSTTSDSPPADTGGDEIAADTGANNPETDNDTDVDAGPEVDNGAPSTTYPAPHPAFPQLVNKAGNLVIATPKAFLIFYPSYVYKDQLEIFAKGVGAQSYWSDAVGEYGVGSLAWTATKEMTGTTAPTTVTDKDVLDFISTHLKAGDFGTPDQNTIYTVFYPQTTTITMSGGPFGTSKSCSTFGGYHSDVNVTVGATTANYAFAVIPTCPTFGGLVGIDGVTGALSHEWAEASTDPFPSTNGGADSTYSSVDDDHFIWNLLGGAENGDLCAQRPEAFFKTTGFDFVTQSCWSNKAAKAGGDPCAPKPNGVYFNAAPVLPDKVTLDLSALGGGSVRTRGITIPKGGSATIEVDLFSDGDTKGAWKVDAIDAIAQFTGGAPTLDFVWDRKSGQNGEKLHLTLTIKSASLFGKAHPFLITSTKGGTRQIWPALASE